MSNRNTIASVASSLNLGNEERVMIVDLAQEVNSDYSAMSLEEMLGEDSRPMYQCASMDEIRAERARNNAMNELLDLQDRMTKGMKMIKDMQRLGFEYGLARDKFNKAKEVMFADDSRKPQAWWDRFNELKYARNKAWNEFDKVRPVLNKYWAHWMNLKDQGCGLAETYNLWPEYFNLINSDMTMYFTHDGDIEDQSVDSRHMNTIEAFSLAHQEEMAVEKAAIDIPFTIPVRNSGYVPPCRDVTHEYRMENGIVDEEWDSLLASCPF